MALKSEITKCTGDTCPIKKGCFRFKPLNEEGEDFMKPPREDGKCVLFLPILKI